MFSVKSLCSINLNRKRIHLYIYDEYDTYEFKMKYFSEITTWVLVFYGKKKTVYFCSKFFN